MIKVNVNKESCIGCGACMQIAGDIFGYGDDGLSEVKKCKTEKNDAIVMAAESCPTGAITITECDNKKECCKGQCAGNCDCGCDSNCKQ